MASDFDGLVAWITGGGTGIGRALALELVARGAKVAVSGRRRDRLDTTVRAVEAAGGQGLAVPCDVTDEASQRKALAAILERFGQLDVVVANAGFAVGGRVEELSAEEWRRQLEVNVIGVATTARLALPELRKTKGRLVLVGSVSAFAHAPRYAAYNASKAAVRALGLTLAAELEGSGVTATTIHPGYVESDIAKVDNEGVYHANWTDKRPHNLMWPAPKAARVMADVIAARKREHVFTGHGKAAALISRLTPGVMHLMMRQKPKPPRKEAEA